MTDEVARRLAASQNLARFSDDLGDGLVNDTIVRPGDMLDISIWEAPPAALFGTTVAGDLPSAMSTATVVSRTSQLPEQVVESSGMIRVPFAGTITAAGRTPQQVAQQIQARLAGKAHDPQVVVRITRQTATEATIVGDVATSVRMQLTPKGERLLDALAAAGGTKQPVDKMTIQVTRGDRVSAMPLESVIRDPRQNIRLQAQDVVTLLFQPYSFTALGSVRRSEEVSFEGTGLTLSQALGRIGGLDDQRANPKGVFIFRFEDAAMFAGVAQPPIQPMADGKIPIIYRVNMRDPAILFAAQSFPIKDKDVIYVSNAPLTDFSKFLQAVSQIVYPIATIQNTNIF
ncbi:polysaccharide export outer membrane protein [Sphingobium xanthum]|uniref:polysaccharide biosynthesis/export family protein n=1 Tax=Sphingobium xanthum TaxID=1387165 RepID=UPI0031BA6BBA